MLNPQNISRMLIVVVFLFVATLVIGVVSRVAPSDGRSFPKSFPMDGVNLSDMRPEEMVAQIAKITGAEEDRIFVSVENFPLQVSGGFDWTDWGNAILLFIAKGETGDSPYYICQLHVFLETSEFWLPEQGKTEPPLQPYPLKDYLDALKYLPQEVIHHYAPADSYFISFMGDTEPEDSQLRVYYNRDGLGLTDEWDIRLDFLPMYYDEEGVGYQSNDSDVIHLLYRITEPVAPDAPEVWSYNIDGKDMTLDDVRTLAAKGDDLSLEDVLPYNGVDASSNSSSHILGFYVEGGYRLNVYADKGRKPDMVNLESVWQSGGSGIDIRYEDVEDFISRNPSQDPISEESAQDIAQTALGIVFEPVSWYTLGELPERADDDTVFARTLFDSVYTISEAVWVLRETGTPEWGGRYYAVGKKSGTIFVCNIADDGKIVWESVDGAAD